MLLFFVYKNVLFFEIFMDKGGYYNIPFFQIYLNSNGFCSAMLIKRVQFPF